MYQSHIAATSLSAKREGIRDPPRSWWSRVGGCRSPALIRRRCWLASRRSRRCGWCGSRCSRPIFIPTRRNTGFGQAPRLRLLLEAAARRLADRGDDRAVRRQRIRGPAQRTVAPCRHRDLVYAIGAAALRAPHRVLVGGGLCGPARRLGLGLYHIDRRAPGAVLGGSALRLHPGARSRRWRWWIAVGIAAGFGLLAKYAMAYWMLSALGFILLVRAERRHLPGLLAALATRLCHLFAEFVVELEQRLCQLSAHPRQCRARRARFPPDPAPRIFRLAIRRLRPAVFRRA